jgi:alkylation response protein AidB-like acyl-CoA dehydrogenase
VSWPNEEWNSVVSEDLDLERKTLAGLIERHGSDTASAWAALAAEGWLDLGPEPDGSWPMAQYAALVCEVAATSGHELGIGAHLSALGTVTAAGESSLGRLAILRDVRFGTTGEIRGRLWGSAAADTVVVELADRTLGIVPGAAVTVVPEPVLPLRNVAVHAAVVAAEDVSAVKGSRDVHEARVAWLLAVEAIAAITDAVDRTIAYAQQRNLFSGTLAGMQVVQHRLVDMRVVGLLGAALTRRAGDEWRNGGPPRSSLPAQVFAGSRGVWAAENAIQLHGGIGFTWELGLHRALALAQRARLLGSVTGSAVAAQVAAVGANPFPDLVDWSRDYRTESW